MNTVTYLAVRKIAKTVRAWAEQEAVRLGFGSELAGMCASASAKIHHMLKDIGIDSKIVYSNSETYGDHCYVLVHNHIVDVTATQFEYYDFEPIVMMPLEKKVVRHYRFWRGTQTFETVVDLITFQQANDWPSEQMAA